MGSDNPVVIGIDLGTTNSCVAAVVNELAEVFENDFGNRVTPSCVSFTDEETAIGDAAKSLKTLEPKRTVYSVKRIIGKDFDNPKAQEDIKTWQFCVKPTVTRRPVIEIEHRKRKETYNVEEISAMILHKMKEVAEARLNESVYEAVITVPAYFNHMQRAATKTAAEIAGIKVAAILNEPTAAAICFGLAKKHSSEKKILVYDLGGGTFDVTILSIKDSVFNVLASSGDSHLGGDDLTNRMVDYYVKEVKMEHADITNDSRAMSKLYEECEKAKKALSHTTTYKLVVECIVEDKLFTFSRVINRTKFVSLTKDLFDKTMNCVEKTIEDAGLAKDDIDYVTSVGGSSKIPHVVNQLKLFFGSDKIRNDRSPEEAIAKGAAIYAAHLSGVSVGLLSKVHLHEVTPLSLGVRLYDKTTTFIINRNSKIPAIGNDVLQTVEDNQKIISYRICQGENKWFKDNDYLDMFELPVTPKPKGEAKTDVCFSLDSNGMLHATAAEIGVGEKKAITIDLCGTLEKLNVEHLKKKHEEIREKEKEHEAYVQAKGDLKAKLDEILESKSSNPEAQKRSESIKKVLEKNMNVSTDELQNYLKDVTSLETKNETSTTQ